MKKAPIIFSFFESKTLTKLIQKSLKYEMGKIEIHQFPDKETLIKIKSLVKNRDLIFIANLKNPNTKILPLIFAAETAKTLGASKIILISPYLPYMRQDTVFDSGEGVSSQYFAKLITNYFNGLITIDPHLHRIKKLNELYSIPTKTIHVIDNIAEWIKKMVKAPVLIGPDSESKQWVFEIAKKIKAPFLILKKTRKSDTQVEIEIPNLHFYQNLQPILIDDIISSATTMVETIHHLKGLKLPPPICIGIHGVFSKKSYEKLLKAGAEKIITTNTLTHPSNAIDISDKIIEVIQGFDFFV